MCYLGNLVDGEHVYIFKCVDQRIDINKSCQHPLKKVSIEVLSCAIERTLGNIQDSWAQVDLECLYAELTRRAERAQEK